MKGNKKLEGESGGLYSPEQCPGSQCANVGFLIWNLSPEKLGSVTTTLRHQMRLATTTTHLGGLAQLAHSGNCNQVCINHYYLTWYEAGYKYFRFSSSPCAQNTLRFARC